MPKLEQARLGAEWALVRTAAGLLRLLPIDVGASLAARLVSWAVMDCILSSSAQEPRNSLSRLVEARPRARRRREVGRNTGRTFAETLQLDRIFSNCSRIEMTGHGALQQCLREPGANVGVTLHMGNWEIVSFAVGLCGARVASVYRQLRNPYLDRYVRLMREHFYPRGLLGKVRARGELPLRSVAIAAKKLLRNGGHIGLVCDQVDMDPPSACLSSANRRHLRRRRRIRPRRRSPDLDRALLAHRSPFAFPRRDQGMPVERTSDRTADLRDTTTGTARQFECWIRDAPEQWMWQRRSISG